MQIIYFSPHLDDAALSCGGLIWQQIQEGHQVSIWTIFAGDPPTVNLSNFAKELHKKWGVGENAVSIRREEDIRSCKILGASFEHWKYPDCIYRINLENDPVYPTEESIFEKYNSIEDSLINEIAQKVKENINSNTVLISPLTIGNHVDHQICRKIIEKVREPDYYYLDYPYIEKEQNTNDSLIPSKYIQKIFEISPKAIKMWQLSVEAHKSQISSFWNNSGEMREEIEKYVEQNGGLQMIVKN